MAALRDLLTSLVTGSSTKMDANGVAIKSEADDVSRWQDELKHAEKFFEEFHKQARRANARFLDDSKLGQGETSGTAPLYRLNLYHSNIETLQSMLYAKIPKAEADRRFFDPNDDIARVAAEMVTRIIQNDMNDPDDTLNEVLKSCLQDRLVAGLGSARVKYYMEEQPVPEMAGEVAQDPATGEVPTQKSDEWCDVIYTHWKDILWSPSRVASELRWKAFRSYMTKDKVTERWGQDVAAAIPYVKSSKKVNDDKSMDLEQTEQEAEIWEIWDNESKKCYWVVKGYTKFLEQMDDPMELGGFYPDARPMLANTSTSKYIPKPDYYFAQDLYAEIDELETRIALLTQAAKCVGVYDRSSKDIGRMLKEGVENELIPVDNWAMFAEKGGIKGMTDWLPLDAVTNAISVLSVQQAGRINQLYQVTGLSDIMRGQATQTNVTATEQKIKAQYGSGRIQAIQEEFAIFAADLLNKKVQLIQRFYDPERIKKLSNIMNTPDAAVADQAIALIKDPDSFNCRISVKSESMAQENLDAIREQRTALIQGMAQFMGMAAPLLQQSPEAAPFLLELLSFSVAGFNGAAEMEGVIDQFGAAVKQKLAQPPPPPPPDPAIATAQAKAQSDQAIQQTKSQAEMQIAQGEAQATAMLQQQQIQSDAQMAAMQEHFKAQTQHMKEQFALQKAMLTEQMKNDRASESDQLKAATAITVAEIGAQSTVDAAAAAAENEVVEDLSE
jgi:hypothetical protein